MIPQESGYRSISTISIRKFDRLAGELQWIDGEVFGKAASVNAIPVIWTRGLLVLELAMCYQNKKGYNQHLSLK